MWRFLLLAQGFSVVYRLQIAGKAHDSFSLQPRDEVDISVTGDPVILVIPPIPGFTATVYKQTNDANIVVGTLGAHNSAFGVLFRGPGKILGSATQAAEFEYFALNSSRPCPIFSVTTSHSDFFAARRDQLFANLTIRNNQKYCLFHLSNSPTNVLGNFSTEDGYDILYLDNGLSERIRTGDGSFQSTSALVTRISWISDASTLSAFFTISFDAPHSTLPAIHLNYTARSWPETSTNPEVLYDFSILHDTTRDPYIHADSDWYLRTGDQNMVDTIVIAVATVFAAVLSVLGICLCLRFCRAQTGVVDDSQLRMLKTDDMAGVRAIAEGREDDAEKSPGEIVVSRGVSVVDEAEGLEIF
jgi:hypothetical protein